MSLYIPDDVQDIIYKYKHNLNMKDTCNELKETFFRCINCKSNCNIHIHGIILTCKECKNHICSPCGLSYIEEKNNICLECYASKTYIKEIERLLKRKLEFHEHDRFESLVNNLFILDLLDLIDYLNDREGNYKYGQDLYNDIDMFIRSEYDLEQTEDYESDYNNYSFNMLIEMNG